MWMHHKPLALLALPAWYAEQGLCNDRVSVRLFGPSFNSRCGVRRVCCRAPRGQNISIDSGGSQRPAAQCSAANAGSVLLTAELARLNTDLFYGIAGPWMSYENKQYSEI